MSSCTSQATSSSDSATAGKPRADASGSRKARWRSRATAMHSATVREGNKRASWKLRPRPAQLRLSGAQPVMS